MNKGLKIFLIILLAGLVASISVVYYAFNKPHRNIYSESPAYSIEAKALYAGFNKNEKLANQKYVDKVIQISGNITELFIDDNQVSIVLNDVISCELDSSIFEKNESAINSFKKGGQITLKGKCDGYDRIMGVVLTRCFIIE